MSLTIRADRPQQMVKTVRSTIALRGVVSAFLYLGIAMPALADDATVRQPEVVVSASRVPLPAQEVGSAVSVVDGADIERRQVRALSDVLREVPGLTVNRSGPIGSLTQVRIRGAEGNQTLVLIDGMEVNDPSGPSEFNFGNLLASDVERVEVLRGPQSALYGSDAIGGVINIITRRGAGPATAGLSVEGGSFRTGQASANLRGGGASYHYAFGITGFSSDGVSIAPKDEGNSEQDGHENRTYGARIGFTPLPDLEIDLTGRYIDSQTDSDRQPAVAGIVRTVDGDVVSDTQQRTGRIQASYSLFDGAWTHQVGAGLNEEKADTRTNGAVTFEADGKKARYDYQTSVFFGTPDFEDARHTVSLQAEREDDSQVTRSAFSSTDLDLTNYGYAGEYRIALWDRLFLSGGARHDDNDIFKDANTWRATAAWLHDATSSRLHTSYGTGVKNPTLFEVFGSTANFTGNPNLTPERSRGWDVGVEQSLLGDRAVIDVTYFNNRITDLIQGSGNTAVNLAGTSRIDGIEVSASVEMAPDLRLTGQYTWTDGEDANGTELVRRARHLASVNLSYRFLEGRASVDLGFDYNGKQDDTQFSNFFASRRNVTLDDFTLVDVAASYAITDKVELFGRVENLLDEDYQQVLGFDNPGIGAVIGVRTRLALF
jgi:vitamin B12 transporter